MGDGIMGICYVCKQESYEMILNTCINCLEKIDKEERLMIRCPMDGDHYGMCDKIGDNKDRNVLYKHLLLEHSKEELVEFITAGVEDH